MAANAFRKALTIKRNTLVSFDSNEALNDALASKLEDAHLDDQGITPIDSISNTVSGSQDDNLLVSIETEATPSDIGGLISIGDDNRQQPIAKGMIHTF